MCNNNHEYWLLNRVAHLLNQVDIRRATQNKFYEVTQMGGEALDQAGYRIQDEDARLEDLDITARAAATDD
jgi:hypothetical protein